MKLQEVAIYCMHCALFLSTARWDEHEKGKAPEKLFGHCSKHFELRAIEDDKLLSFCTVNFKPTKECKAEP